MMMVTQRERKKNHARSCLNMNSYGNFDEREGKRVKSSLKTFGRDIVEQDRELDLVIGRDVEIQKMCLILSSTTRRNNPLLIGESGVGKTAIVKEFSRRISRGNVPDTLNGARVIALDAWVLAAGGRECRKILRAISEEVDRNVILFIDDIHLVFKAKRSGDAKIFLRDILKSSEIRCIGATTPKEFRKYIENDDAGFCSWFWEVLVAEPSVNDTISILRRLKQRYQAYHGVQILDSALEAAAKLSDRYITAWSQPDKAIDTLDEACASLAVQLQSKPKEINDLEIKSRRLHSEFGSLENQGDKASKAPS